MPNHSDNGTALLSVCASDKHIVALTNLTLQGRLNVPLLDDGVEIFWVLKYTDSNKDFI